MSDPIDSTLIQMLAMAAISYRGFNLIGPASYKLARLRQTLDESFGRFPSVKDRWKVAWGPAVCGLSTFGPDDVVVYVAEAVDDPSRLAVVIRGTNPVSLADWVFGDLMFDETVPWLFGDKTKTTGARISASTALGLAIIRRLTWSQAGVLANGPAENPKLSFTESIEAWVARIGTRLTSSLSGEIKRAIPHLADRTYDPIEALGLRRIAGQTLKEFLRQRVAAVSKSQTPAIYVTGHSKGGALSSTVALWLADTQGSTIQANELWDPDSRAKIRCYSFAGPTAGNATFAAYSDARLGADCRRIWNRMDIVPRAFVAADLKRISSDYRLSGLVATAVDKLIDYVTEKAQKQNYKQICGGGTALDCDLVDGKIFPAQIAHQHLDSYLQKTGLSNEMSAAILFTPVL